MKDLLDKLSSYNIFNYLLPGVLTALVLSQLTHVDVLQSDIVVGVFVYYFVGLVVSRVGSLLIEPALKKIGFVKFASYGSYIRASKNDQAIEILSEVNNMYRTLTSMFVCLSIVYAYESIVAWCPAVGGRGGPLLMAALFILFLTSYRKQTAYIKSRCEESGQ